MTTAKELIATLSELPPDSIVKYVIEIDGDEGDCFSCHAKFLGTCSLCKLFYARYVRVKTQDDDEEESVHSSENNSEEEQENVKEPSFFSRVVSGGKGTEYCKQKANSVAKQAEKDHSI